MKASAVGEILVLARPERGSYLAALFRQHGLHVVQTATAAQAAELARNAELAVVESSLLADLPALALVEGARARRMPLLIVGEPDRPAGADLDSEPALFRRVPADWPSCELVAVVEALLATRRQHLTRKAEQVSRLEKQVREQVRQHWSGIVARDLEESLAAILHCCAALSDSDELEETARILLVDLERAGARTRDLLCRLADTWERQESA